MTPQEPTEAGAGWRRKSMEPMAARSGVDRPGMQQFLAGSTRSHQTVPAEVAWAANPSPANAASNASSNRVIVSSRCSATLHAVLPGMTSPAPRGGARGGGRRHVAR
ncbi:hypothetical protein PV755_22575 [Streptomyces caniscabiei]|uniref:hypothetical protein n=1 Tax=Streptomyces caniscabiei TaxID=2746961 RepID=UPI001CE1EC68|nr:hypothetical protein [Streptomyces caniscabiei]MDX3511687.1 hypothetical protein [Streptomyces caniscabiei]MDX3719236.1 hypothetical protein [Streptomyces caniscabiei]MDX3726051.1 hypothetical protein [Streptomyces caniscabiei]WEO29621.1 hypothetical protein IHE65_44235 [Streptomyces caniscabiei]